MQRTFIIAQRSCKSQSREYMVNHAYKRSEYFNIKHLCVGPYNKTKAIERKDGALALVAVASTQQDKQLKLSIFSFKENLKC